MAAQLKRIHLLQQLEPPLFVSLAALRCPRTCQDVTRALAAERADQPL
jgi:hypothetical protein